MLDREKPLAPTLYSEDVLLERVTNASRELVFFFGSPLTIPEAAGQPGVPGVAAMVKLIAAELSESPAALTGAMAKLSNGDAGGAYREAFSQLQAFRVPVFTLMGPPVFQGHGARGQG